MKSSKVLAVLATLGLAAAVATPAMALENQFSGAFTSFYDLSNYSAVGGTPADDAPTENYFVQRVRLDYTAKASEEVKLVTKFELDYNWYGNNSYDTARGGGAAIGADGINIETKNLYLDLNLPKNVNTKIGMMGNTDSFKGVIFDADMAGIMLAHSYDNASVTAGFFRFNDSTDSATWDNINTIGKHTRDMFALDGKYSVSKDLKVGAAYYYIADNLTNGFTTTTTTTDNGTITVLDADGATTHVLTLPPTVVTTTTADPNNDLKIHTLGLNAEGTVGPLTLTGFALKQFGDLTSTTKAKGYAFNLGANMPLAGGTARAELLYAGGGDNQLYVVPGEGGAFYNNEMIILSRDKNATTIDNAIVMDINNNSQGVIFGSLGYDYSFTPKLSGSANLGFAQVAKDLADHDSNYLGTEVNCEANYKLMPSVTVGARAGYVVLGDYFKTAGSTLDNPYDVKLIAKFSF